MSQPFARNGRADWVRSRGTNHADRVPSVAASGSGLAVWGEVDKGIYDRFVGACLDAGTLTSLNSSSDGGVLHAAVLHGGWRYDCYARNGAEADEFFDFCASCLESDGFIPHEYGRRIR